MEKAPQDFRFEDHADGQIAAAVIHAFFKQSAREYGSAKHQMAHGCRLLLGAELLTGSKLYSCLIKASVRDVACLLEDLLRRRLLLADIPTTGENFWTAAHATLVWSLSAAPEMGFTEFYDMALTARKSVESERRQELLIEWWGAVHDDEPGNDN